jgi:hypothetical protein
MRVPLWSLGTSSWLTQRGRKKDSNLLFRSILAGEFVKCYSMVGAAGTRTDPGFLQIADGLQVAHASDYPLQDGTEVVVDDALIDGFERTMLA